MSTWGTLATEIQAILQDGTFDDTGEDYAKLMAWANRICNEIATEINVRTLLSSASITFTTDNNYASLPTDFMKISDRFTRVIYDDTPIDIVTLETLNSYDLNHDDETTNVYPDYVAIEGTTIFCYPLFAGDITFENYYKIPTAVAATGDSFELPFVYKVDDLIINGVCGKYGFPFLNEIRKDAEQDLATLYLTKYIADLEQYRELLRKNNSKKEIIRDYY